MATKGEHGLSSSSERNGASGQEAQAQLNNFVVPPLVHGQSISEWEPLFKASIVPLLARPGGEKLAIGLLPGYICRRVAEVELVKEAVKLDSLDEVFILLRTLDDHVDPYEAMQKLCRADWLQGVHIDDFYYTLKPMNGS